MVTVIDILGIFVIAILLIVASAFDNKEGFSKGFKGTIKAVLSPIRKFIQWLNRQ